MKKLACALPLLLIMAGCGLKKQIDETVSNATTEAINVIDDAIADLSSESANWREIMQQAINEFPDEIQSTIKNELTDLLNRAVAATGAEVRCNADFVRNRLTQGLQNLKAKILGNKPPALEPQLCNVIPLAIDTELPPVRRNKIEFYGYDFDQTQVKVFLQNGDQEVDISRFLDQPTHYHMTLNLGGNGVPIGSNSQRILLKWNDRNISSIGILQQAVDVCRSRFENYVPSNVSFIPPHTNGDREYNGNGPNISCRVRIINRRTQVDAEIYMRARETKSDWTEAKGTKTITLFEADPGWEIANIIGPTESAYSFRDNDHKLDNFEGSGPVRTFTFMGDGEGDDAGIHTIVSIAFNRLRLELKENRDCVSDAMVKDLAINKEISSKRMNEFARLRPELLRKYKIE